MTPSNRRTFAIIIVVAAVLFCLCVACAGSLWLMFGDGSATLSRIRDNAAMATATPTIPAHSSTGTGREETPTASATPDPRDFPQATEAPTLAPKGESSMKQEIKVIDVCPEKSLGYHPDTGEALIFHDHDFFYHQDPNDPTKMTGDANILCEFELYSLSSDYQITLPEGGADIVADWSHGWNYDEAGNLLDLCPTGAECEGTWVAVKDFIVHKGDLVHVFVYQREQPAKQRFTTKITWTGGFMDPFACEYISKAGHDMANIRVPEWADQFGTIYGFGLDDSDPSFLTCPGATGEAGNPGHPILP